MVTETYLCNGFESPSPIIISYGYVVILVRGGNRRGFFVRSIQELSKEVGVEFQKDGMHVELLLVNCNADIWR